MLSIIIFFEACSMLIVNTVKILARFDQIKKLKACKMALTWCLTDALFKRRNLYLSVQNLTCLVYPNDISSTADSDVKLY